MVKFLQAKVFHKRHKPHNVFCYKAGYILLPLIGQFKTPKFFSIDNPNLFSFYNKDHGKRNGEQTLDWIYKKISEIGIKKDEVSQITLLTHPRCFGFVFNPVSFYFCLNFEGEPIAIIAEVNNTFSQTHSYTIYEQDLTPIVQHKVYHAKKEFFVSPFFQVEGRYEFRFFYSKEKIAVFINYFSEEMLAFETSVISSVVEFTSRNALPYIFTTFKTILLIVFQAFILKFLKKLTFRIPSRQSATKTNVNNL